MTKTVVKWSYYADNLGSATEVMPDYLGNDR